MRPTTLLRPAIQALAVGAVLMFALMASARPAAADFRVCNNTGGRIGIAMGYKEGEGWTTEGWWNISARTCESLLKGSFGRPLLLSLRHRL